MGYSQTFQRLIAPLGDRVRVKLDPEGWPYVLCKYGRLEWRGRESDGRACVYAYTDHKQPLGRLRKVCTPVQVGETEGAFRCDIEEQIIQAADILHPRRKRAPETGRNSVQMALMRSRIRAQETT